jgi:hypothetical protein
MRPAALHARVARLEAAAEQASTPSVGRQIVDILEGRDPGPRLTDEELGRTRVGRLLLERRQRWAEADLQA